MERSNRERASLPVRTLTTGSDCTCGVLESLDHPKSCVLLSTTPAKTQDDPWVDDSGGTLRTLTTGSERSNRERPSLPVRTLTTGSERSSGVFPSLGHHQSCVLLTKTPAKTQDHPWVDVSQPSLRTLTTGSERSNRERQSLPVRTLFILIAPFFNTF